MSNAAPHPYTITVLPLPDYVDQFGWTLRKGERLFERSDRVYETEAKAYANAMKAIDHDLKPKPSDWP